MHTYNTAPPADELARAQTELNQVRDIMVQNVEQILSRGERIELLVDKTDNMANQATEFRRGARATRRGMWWKNTKVTVLAGVVALVSLMVLYWCGWHIDERALRSSCGSLLHNFVVPASTSAGLSDVCFPRFEVYTLYYAHRAAYYAYAWLMEIVFVLQLLGKGALLSIGATAGCSLSLGPLVYPTEAWTIFRMLHSIIEPTDLI